MFFRSCLLVFALALPACGRPSLSEHTLRLSVIREGAAVTSVWLALEDERFPCERFEGTVTVNGVAMRQQTDGTQDRGSYLFIPNPGCLPPSYELDGAGSASLSGPFELVIDSGGERAVVRSEELLAIGFGDALPVEPGGTLRLEARGDFQAVMPLGWLEVAGPGLELDPEETSAVRWQKLDWRSWEARLEGLDLVAGVPGDMPPGTYEWTTQTLHVQVPLQQCEGVRACDASFSLNAKGTVTVAP